MMIIHAFIYIKPEHRELFIEKSKHIIEHSQSEEGNISYELFEQTSEPNTFVMLEEWKDLAAIEFHNETPHFKKFIQETGGMFSQPPKVKRFEVIQNS